MSTVVDLEHAVIVSPRESRSMTDILSANTKTTSNTNRAHDIGKVVVKGITLLPASIASFGFLLIGKPSAAANKQMRWLTNYGDASISTTDTRSRIPSIVIANLSGVFIGVLSWLTILLAGPNTARNLLYGFIYRHDYQTAWGGPTLAGVWLTHAAISIALLPVYFFIVWGLSKLHGLVSTQLMLRRATPKWVLPLDAAVIIAGLTFLVALVNQL